MTTEYKIQVREMSGLHAHPWGDQTTPTTDVEHIQYVMNKRWMRDDIEAGLLQARVVARTISDWEEVAYPPELEVTSP